MTSIIIPVYNLARYVTEALDSVRAQTDPDWEVIVVDDCSTDDSRAVIQAYLDHYRDPRIRLIWPEQNGGVSRARNLGAAHTRGEWLAFLDGDDAYQPDFLATMLAFTSKTGADASFCRIQYFGEDASLYHEEFNPSAAEIAALPASLVVRNFLQPSAALVRRSAFDQVGGFSLDPELQHVEDWDCWIRLFGVGARIAFHATYTGTYYRKHSAAATTKRLMMNSRTLHLYEQHPEIKAWNVHGWNSTVPVLRRHVACMQSRAGLSAKSLANIGKAFREKPLSIWPAMCALIWLSNRLGIGVSSK